MKRFSKKLKKGISLVEIVVSIFLIMLISGAAVTVISQSVKSDQKKIMNTQVALSTQTAIDCFNYANDFDELFSVLSIVDIDYKNVQGTNVITLSKQSYSVRIVADFEQKVITISAMDKEGKSLSNLTYKKG